MGDEDEDEHDVAELDAPTGVGVDDGGEGDEEDRAGHEGGAGEEDELQFANVEQAGDGDGDEGGEAVAVGAEALEEGVELAAGAPLAEGPEEERGKGDVAEGDQHREVQVLEGEGQRIVVQLLYSRTKVSRFGTTGPGRAAVHGSAKRKMLVSLKRSLIAAPLIQVGDYVIADGDGKGEREGDPKGAVQVGIGLNVPLDVGALWWNKDRWNRSKYKQKRSSRFHK